MNNYPAENLNDARYIEAQYGPMSELINTANWQRLSGVFRCVECGRSMGLRELRAANFNVSTITCKDGEHIDYNPANRDDDMDIKEYAEIAGIEVTSQNTQEHE